MSSSSPSLSPSSSSSSIPSSSSLSSIFTNLVTSIVVAQHNHLLATEVCLKLGVELPTVTYTKTYLGSGQSYFMVISQKYNHFFISVTFISMYRLTFVKI